jgi:hypothetical protein
MGFRFIWRPRVGPFRLNFSKRGLLSATDFHDHEKNKRLPESAFHGRAELLWALAAVQAYIYRRVPPPAL